MGYPPSDVPSKTKAVLPKGEDEINPRHERKERPNATHFLSYTEGTVTGGRSG